MQPPVVRRVRDPMRTPEILASVLLVIGDGNLRAVAGRALRAEGFDVEAVAHAGHALLACLGGRWFDVLVTELAMPDMPGPVLAERVRRHYPGLPVLYLAETGTPAREGVLVRPFTRDDLARRLTLALAETAAWAGKVV
jgi:DNA-binding NtrC family response regulator